MKRVIVNGQYIQDPSDDDLAQNDRPAGGGAYRRDADREDHYADMIQPFIGGKANPEFAKVYPKQAKNIFTKEELKEV